MTTDTGSCGGGGTSVRAVPDAADERERQCHDPAHHLHPDDAFDRNQLAAIVEANQIGLEFLGRLIPLRGIGFEAFRDHAVKRFGDLGRHGPGRRRRFQHPALELGDRAFGANTAVSADEGVVQNQTESVNVGALINWHSFRLLRRHVFDGSHDDADHRRLDNALMGPTAGDGRRGSLAGASPRPAGRPRDAEIHDQGSSPSASIMMLAGFRSRCTTPALCAATSPETIARAMRMTRRTGSLPSRFRTRRQVGALDERHRDVLDAVDLAEVVNADDVLVGDLTGEQQLALEAPLDFGRRARDPPSSLDESP